MKFTNSFHVPLAPEAAWDVLMDIPRIAPCMPGAELTDVVDGDTYKGKVAVRMGPVTLAFAGTARFEERDPLARTARVKAQGQDTKGRGGASAVARFRLEPDAGGSRVEIETDLNLSGTVAQYGRGSGMIQTIAAQLIDQFATALSAEIARTAAPAAGAEAASSPPPPAAAAKPIGGFSLLFRALLQRLRAAFGGA